ERDAVALLYGHRPGLADEADAGEPSGCGDAEPDEGEYPIRDRTRIIICTHAQIGRRGFSRFIRPIWTLLAATPPTQPGQADRPAFALIIDELGQYLRANRWELELAHRVRIRHDPDGSGGRLEPVWDCPKSARSGNCANCTLEPTGGEPHFNRWLIREL